MARRCHRTSQTGPDTRGKARHGGVGYDRGDPGRGRPTRYVVNDDPAMTADPHRIPHRSDVPRALKPTAAAPSHTTAYHKHHRHAIAITGTRRQRQREHPIVLPCRSDVGWVGEDSNDGAAADTTVPHQPRQRPRACRLPHGSRAPTTDGGRAMGGNDDHGRDNHGGSHRHSPPLSLLCLPCLPPGPRPDDRAPDHPSLPLTATHPPHSHCSPPHTPLEQVMTPRVPKLAATYERRHNATPTKRDADDGAGHEEGATHPHFVQGTEEPQHTERDDGEEEEDGGGGDRRRQVLYDVPRDRPNRAWGFCLALCWPPGHHHNPGNHPITTERPNDNLVTPPIL
ncbi:hypothetical protein BDZ97DRAFT_1922367 [Flammula alnicola]|nr:hypothetical protein BDZ97DRAFT_1922367 [Flammula alnicola]